MRWIFEVHLKFLKYKFANEKIALKRERGMVMKLDKKVVIILGVVAIVMAIAISAFVANRNNNLGEVVTPGKSESMSGGNTALDEFKPLNQKTNLSEILAHVKKTALEGLKGIADSEANNLLDLREYAGLEKHVAISNEANEYAEIWLFKISKLGDAENIFRLFDERIKNQENDSSLKVDFE